VASSVEFDYTEFSALRQRMETAGDTITQISLNDGLRMIARLFVPAKGTGPWLPKLPRLPGSCAGRPSSRLPAVQTDRSFASFSPPDRWRAPSMVIGCARGQSPTISGRSRPRLSDGSMRRVSRSSPCWSIIRGTGRTPTIGEFFGGSCRESRASSQKWGSGSQRISQGGKPSWHSSIAQ